MPVNTCAFVVGNLLELRADHGYRSVGDVDDMLGMIRAQTAKLPLDAKFAIAADWRALGVMAPETAARAREMLASVNPRVTRAAILTLPENSTTNLQVLRLIREAASPNGRHFTAASELCAWLSEGVGPAEARRLRVFLDLAAA
jgi:hypothetical protein